MKGLYVGKSMRSLMNSQQRFSKINFPMRSQMALLNKNIACQYVESKLKRSNPNKFRWLNEDNNMNLLN